jgi:hypothetical protein
MWAASCSEASREAHPFALMLLFEYPVKGCPQRGHFFVELAVIATPVLYSALRALSAAPGSALIWFRFSRISPSLSRC